MITKNLYGTIGHTILTKGNKKIIVFADKHDKLPKCAESVKIADWFEKKIKKSKLLLEEVPRGSVELAELWTESEHTQDLKNLYLKNPNIIVGLDIRPLVIPFSWETYKDRYKNKEMDSINTVDYLRYTNDFFSLKNPWLVENFPKYNTRTLKNTKVGEHFLKIKENFRNILVDNKKLIAKKLINVIEQDENFLYSFNDILDQIMEWYICANVELNIDNNIMIHAGLSHSDTIVQLLREFYGYVIIEENGVNSMYDLFLIDSPIGCTNISNEIDKQFGGTIIHFNL